MVISWVWIRIQGPLAVLVIETHLPNETNLSKLYPTKHIKAEINNKFKVLEKAHCFTVLTIYIKIKYTNFD